MALKQHMQIFEQSFHTQKEDIQLANKHIKRCSSLLAIRKIQFKPQWDIITQFLKWLKLKRLTRLS